jgi:hypothetical protein
MKRTDPVRQSCSACANGSALVGKFTTLVTHGTIDANQLIRCSECRREYRGTWTEPRLPMPPHEDYPHY